MPKTKSPKKEKWEEEFEKANFNTLTKGIVADYFYRNEAKLGDSVEENHVRKIETYNKIRENLKSFIKSQIEQAKREVVEEIIRDFNETAITGMRDQDEVKGLYLFRRFSDLLKQKYLKEK